MTTWTGTPTTIPAGMTTGLAAALATYRDAIKAASEAWTSYTPTWTAASVNPAIGNGSLSGAYSQVGKLIHFRLRITMGSTTTYGTGAWYITVPVTPSSGYPVNTMVCAATGADVSTGNVYTLVGLRFNAADGRLALAGPANAATAATTPVMWANGDIISISGSYEAA